MIAINLLWATLVTLGLPFSAFTDNPVLADAAENRPRMILILAMVVGLPFLSAVCGIVLLAAGWALGRPRWTITAAVILAIPYVVAVVLSAVPSF